MIVTLKVDTFLLSIYTLTMNFTSVLTMNFTSVLNVFLCVLIELKIPF